ncbi:MAG: c-type cytochrome [Planctomycetaceae bacterium]|nr:c-type cytochrome [Planctomycetaceae bacterium]
MNLQRSFLCSYCVILLCVSCLIGQPLAADDAGALANTQAGTPLSAEEATALITVSDGFEVTLFAGEPDVQQPISMTIDERGRVWVAENYTYAEAAVNFDTQYNDRVVILEDTDHDGRSDKRKVFWDSAKRLTSVEVGFGGVWVLAAPQLLFIPDRDHDDVPDGPPVVVLDGWNGGAVRHNIVNGLKWGPDGWLYGRHGILANSFVGKPGSTPSQRTELNCCVWRYHPTREVFEVVGQGTTNSWGFDYDKHGQMFFINTVIGHLWHLIPGAHYRRMYGADFNPHLYQYIEQCADHFHWDTGEKWSDIRHGVSDTTSQAGGGHAHSGLMIYQGDNWPESYRDHMYTINLHGLRINHDTLERDGAGYTSKHAEDFLFANNEWFRGLDLISGPDGGVYVVDWSDIGECHENDGVHRTSGRIYKVTYGKPSVPTALDLSRMTNAEMVELLRHPNVWQARTARRLLQERAAAGDDLSGASEQLLTMFTSETDEILQLRAMWCLNSIGATDAEWLHQQISHPSEHVRLWAVRFLTENGNVRPDTVVQLENMASTESSGLVRLYLAAALQRLQPQDRWKIATSLARHAEDASDRQLPLMIWYGIEGAVPLNPEAAVALVEQSQIPLIRRHIVRRLTAELDSQPEPVDRLITMIGTRNDSDFQLDLLRGMNEALRGWRQAPMLPSWSRAAEIVLMSPSDEVRSEAQKLGVVFGDGRALDALQEIVVDTTADAASRRSALRSLVNERVPEALPLLKQLFNDAAIVNETILGFAAFDDPDVPRLILDRYGRLDPEGQSDSINTLTSRPSYASALLVAVADGRINVSDISAYHARQMRSFQDPALDQELDRLWGTVRETSAEKQQMMADLRSQLDVEQLASADLSQGRVLFEKTCSTCHVLYGKGGRIGPDLTGANRHNLNYLLENIVDPSAAVSKGFQVSAIALKDGRIITGVIVESSDRVVTVQTQKDRLSLSRDGIEEIVAQETSLMPDGLLKQFTSEQIRDLFAYLSSTSQVELPSELPTDRFVDAALRPFWTSTHITEPLFFIEPASGSRPSAQMLFEPEAILSVASATGQTTYEVDRDYEYDRSTNSLILPKGSRIPFTTQEQLYPLMTSDLPKIRRQEGDQSRGILFDNEAGYHDLQVEVTYDCREGQWQGPVPRFAGDQLPHLMQKLRAQEPVSIVLCGDSISAGYNASKFTGAEPGCPAYGELVALSLQKHFGSEVTFTNHAVGGWNAARGLKQVIEDRVGEKRPDLVIIAFGMNDVFGRDADVYQQNVRGIIDAIRELSPNTEFVLVSTMLGNAEWGMPMEQFPLSREKLRELCGEGVVLADLTEIWEELLKHKSFYDLTGNGVNHPNDFGHTVYAQVILSLLINRTSSATTSTP